MHDDTAKAKAAEKDAASYRVLPRNVRRKLHGINEEEARAGAMRTKEQQLNEEHALCFHANEA